MSAVYSIVVACYVAKSHSLMIMFRYQQYVGVITSTSSMQLMQCLGGSDLHIVMNRFY